MVSAQLAAQLDKNRRPSLQQVSRDQNEESSGDSLLNFGSGWIGRSEVKIAGQAHGGGDQHVRRGVQQEKEEKGPPGLRKDEVVKRSLSRKESM